MNANFSDEVLARLQLPPDYITMSEAEYIERKYQSYRKMDSDFSDLKIREIWIGIAVLQRNYDLLKLENAELKRSQHVQRILDPQSQPTDGNQTCP